MREDMTRVAWASVPSCESSHQRPKLQYSYIYMCFSIFMQVVNVMAGILFVSFANGNVAEGSAALTLDTPLDFALSAPR